jgi:hypothetical protein
MQYVCESCRFAWEGGRALTIGEVVDAITPYLYCPRCGNLLGKKDATDRIKTVTGDENIRILE